MRARQSFIKAVPIIVTISLLAGCGGSIKSKVEKGIAQSLPGLIGPAKSYRVRVSGSTVDMVRSRLDEIEIKGEGIRLKNGMTLSRLDVWLKGVRFNAETRAITRCDSATFAASLAQEELERYLRKTYPNIPGLEIELQSGQLVASASPSLVGLTTSINAESALKIRNAKQLVLDLRRVTVGGLPAPGFARDYIESKLNPVFDTAALGYEATVTSVAIQRGFLTIGGTIDLVGK